MGNTKLLSIVLLFVFFSFLITQYPGGHVNSIADHEHQAVISSDPLESFLLNDDLKKFFVKLYFHNEMLWMFALALALIFSGLIRAFQRVIFFTPIFYQSNYVDDAPSCS